jgi:hypothetical protein
MTMTRLRPFSRDGENERLLARLGYCRSRGRTRIWRPATIVQMHAMKQRVRAAIEEFESDVFGDIA